MVTEGVVAMVEAGVVDSEEEDKEGIKLSPSFLPKIRIFIKLLWRAVIEAPIMVTPLPRKGVSMNIYVGNLSLEVTEDELRQVFINFGEVISVILMNNKYIGSGQSRGYGFVEMPSKSEGEAAVTALRDKTIRGRVIEVVEALPLSDNKAKRSFRSRIDSRFNKKARQREDIKSQLGRLTNFRET